MILDRKINSLLLKILVIGFFLAQSGCTPSILLKSELKIDKTQPVEKQVRFENFVNKTLTLGEEIATDAHTIKVISFPNGVEVILKPNTRIKISSVIFFIGDVIVKTTGKFFKRTRNYFEVKTEQVIASIEGTQFQMSVDRQGNVSALVLEGVVKLTPTMPVWPWKLLESSQKAMIRGQQPPQIISARPSEIDEINQFIKQVDEVVNAAKATNEAFGAIIAILFGAIITESLGRNKDETDNKKVINIPNGCTTPNVYGMEKYAAIDVLKQEGFKNVEFELVDNPNAAVNAWEVYEQSPPANNKVACDAQVLLKVKQEQQLCIVPNVVGLKVGKLLGKAIEVIEDATQTLKEAGFNDVMYYDDLGNIKNIDSAPYGWRVDDQIPTANSKIPCNQAISLRVWKIIG